MKAIFLSFFKWWDLPSSILFYDVNWLLMIPAVWYEWMNEKALLVTSSKDRRNPLRPDPFFAPPSFPSCTMIGQWAIEIPSLINWTPSPDATCYNFNVFCWFWCLPNVNVVRHHAVVAAGPPLCWTTLHWYALTGCSA